MFEVNLYAREDLCAAWDRPISYDLVLTTSRNVDTSYDDTWRACISAAGGDVASTATPRGVYLIHRAVARDVTARALIWNRARELMPESSFGDAECVTDNADASLSLTLPEISTPISHHWREHNDKMERRDSIMFNQAVAALQASLRAVRSLAENRPHAAAAESDSIVAHVHCTNELIARLQSQHQRTRQLRAMFPTYGSCIESAFKRHLLIQQAQVRFPQRQEALKTAAMPWLRRFADPLQQSANEEFELFEADIALRRAFRGVGVSGATAANWLYPTSVDMFLAACGSLDEDYTPEADDALLDSDSSDDQSDNAESSDSDTHVDIEELMSCELCGADKNAPTSCMLA